jgi:phytanoyl-CoA hydroxylase
VIEGKNMLTAPQIQQFNTDGYTVFPGLLTAGEVEALLAATGQATAGHTLAKHDTDRLEMEPDQPPEGTAVRRLYEPCSHYPIFKELSEKTKLLDCVEQLFGPDLLFHYSKLNMKPAAIGSVVEWHQDLSYYPMTNTDSLAVLFYLDDTEAKNGALQLLPGHHRDPLMSHSRQGYFQGRMTQKIQTEQAEMATGPAGTAIFMHGMTPHASAPNTSERPRRTLILSYRAADAFPVFCGPMTAKNETFVRLVRGKRASAARFDRSEFPIPQYKEKTVSLYELQQRSRQGELE